MLPHLDRQNGFLTLVKCECDWTHCPLNWLQVLCQGFRALLAANKRSAGIPQATLIMSGHLPQLSYFAPIT